MLDTKKGLTGIDGLCVYDAIVITNIIDKLLKTGAVTGKEVGHVASLRAKATAAVQRAIGLDLDNPSPEAASND